MHGLVNLADRSHIENQPFPRRPSRVDDDPYIRGYYSFLLEHQNTDWKHFDGTSSDQDPALVQVHRLRWSTDAEDRAIVEARILATETPLKDEDCPGWLDDVSRAKIRRAALMEVAKFNKTNMHRLFRMHLDLIKQESNDHTAAANVEKNVAALVENLRCLEGLPDQHPA